MNISIDYQSRTPIYEQIVKGVEKLVILNVLKPNEQIPSIRELACSLGINPNTVKKAYDILDSKGFILFLIIMFYLLLLKQLCLFVIIYFMECSFLGCLPLFRGFGL